MTGEHETTKGGASSEAKGEETGARRPLGELAREAVVVTVAAAFRAGDAIAAATEGPRHSARRLVSDVAKRARRIADEARATAQRAADEAAAREGGADKGAKRRTKRGTRS